MRQLKITQSITNRSDLSFEKYLTDISKYEMVSVEEEVKLARRIREGDEKALEKLVRANLRFVVSVAKQYQNQGLPIADLVSEGNTGLIKAAKKFDERRGFKFISYAVWWIRQSILESLSEKSRVIRIPLNQIGVLSKINKVYSKLEQDLERPPTEEEIAAQLDYSEEKIIENIRSTRNSVSLDAPLGNESENFNMLDLLTDELSPGTDQSTILDSLRTDIERSLDTLDPKSRDILKMYFGIGYSHPKSLDEIGIKYNLTRERVRQLKERSIKQLRSGKRRSLLRSHL